jgi:hypothetical protein
VSSSGARNAFYAGSSGFVRLKPAEHLITQSSTKRTDGLGLGVASGQALGNVSLPETGAAELSHSDPVKGDIELTVAAAVEPMAHEVA